MNKTFFQPGNKVICNAPEGPYIGQVCEVIKQSGNDGYTFWYTLKAPNGYHIESPDNWIRELTQEQKDDIEIEEKCYTAAEKAHHRRTTANKCEDGKLSCPGCPYIFNY